MLWEPLFFSLVVVSSFNFASFFVKAAMASLYLTKIMHAGIVSREKTKHTDNKKEEEEEAAYE